MRKLSNKERYRLLREGKISPRNSKEAAILIEAENKRAARRIEQLHASAALNKKGTLAGKIVFVPRNCLDK